jgi:hypothetical protein
LNRHPFRLKSVLSTPNATGWTLNLSAIYARAQYKLNPVGMPVTGYPQADGISYTKMRAVTDWWKIFRPVFFLGLGLKKRSDTGLACV